MEDSKKTNNEAPFIAFTSFKTSNNFVWSFTIRENTAKELIEKIKWFEEFCEKEKWTPEEKYAKKAFGGGYEKKEIEYVDGVKCPKCGNRAVRAKTKMNKEYWKCETQKYDFKTRTSSGCDWVNWNPESI